MLANPNQAAISVTVTISGHVIYMAPAPIPPNGHLIPALPSVRGGPIEVVAWNATTGAAMPILATQRHVDQNQRTDLWMVPRPAISADSFFSTYDGIGTKGADWIIVANPTATTETVRISIAGKVLYTKALGAGQVDRPKFGSLRGGPVEVTGTGANGMPAPVLATQRWYWNGMGLAGTFDEVTGMPRASLGGSAWFPYYDLKATAGSGLAGREQPRHADLAGTCERGRRDHDGGRRDGRRAGQAGVSGPGWWAGARVGHDWGSARSRAGHAADGMAEGQGNGRGAAGGDVAATGRPRGFDHAGARSVVMRVV